MAVSVAGAKVFEVERKDVFMLRNILPGAAWAPYSSGVPARLRGVELIDEEIKQEGSSLKGLVVALVLEMVLAAGVYEAWHVWHFLR